MLKMSNNQTPGKSQYGPLTKLTLICIFFFTLLFFVFRQSSSSNLIQLTQTQHLQLQPTPTPTQHHPCTQLPPNISQTLIHYATSKRTPQQTLAEISVTDRVLRRKSPCNFLVFGLGHDSLLWSALNSGGRTLFLEESSKWIRVFHAAFPDLEFRHVSYSTRLRQADDLLRSAQSSPACAAVADPRKSDCVLALKTLPDEVYEVEWDVIMVDAPTGFDDDAPGRMTAIYTAGLMARNRKSGGETDVMVHDVERPVEDRFSKAFLCEGYLEEEEGKLRRFVVPSHRGSPGRPFCPQI